MSEQGKSKWVIDRDTAVKAFMQEIHDRVDTAREDNRRCDPSEVEDDLTKVLSLIENQADAWGIPVREATSEIGPNDGEEDE